MPFGTILDPIYASPASNQIVGYTRCGDSALWTGAYLAAEAFRYKVTRSADALNNVKTALAGLKGLADVTGDNRLARCMVLAASPYAAGIESEEAANTIHPNGQWVWVDNTSRDQVVGAFFGLGAAYDVVDDATVKSDIADLKHTGDRWGGSITAALFLKEFVGNVPWIHCDIAGPVVADRPKDIYPKGATGHPVLTFLRFVEAMS